MSDKVYLVLMQETWLQEAYVEASSLEEARQKAVDCSDDMAMAGDPTFLERQSEMLWRVEEANVTMAGLYKLNRDLNIARSDGARRYEQQHRRDERWRNES